MEHIWEFKKWQWSARRGGKPVLVLLGDSARTRTLVAEDFSRYLKSVGIAHRILQTPLEEEEGYLFEMTEKVPLDQILYQMPVTDSKGSRVEIWYQDTADERVAFHWTWMQGVHR